MSRASRVFSILPLAVFLCLAALSCDNAPPPPAEATELTLLNWEEYYDQSVLDDFKERTGITVRIEEYGQAPECIARFQNNPAAFDLVITDGPTIEFLARAGLLAELDPERLPNLKHIDERLRGVRFDPEGKFSIPYLFGTTGLAVNTKYVPKPIRRWRDLLDPALKGRIALFDDPYEAMMGLLLAAGHPINSTSPEHVADAAEIAAALHEQDVVLSDYVPLQDRLMAGDIWVTMAYSGDLLKATQDHPEIEYVIPEEGGGKWIDSYAVSRYTKKTKAVYQFLDYVMEPEIAARISNSQHYATPNKDAMPLLDRATLDNPVIYPSDEILDRCDFLVDVGEASNEYTRVFAILTSGQHQ